MGDPEGAAPLRGDEGVPTLMGDGGRARMSEVGERGVDIVTGGRIFDREGRKLCCVVCVLLLDAGLGAEVGVASRFILSPSIPSVEAI